MSISFASEAAISRTRQRTWSGGPQPPTSSAVYLTPEGLAALQAQHQILTEVMRPEVAQRLRDAREFGASAENGEFLAVREEEEILAGLIAHLSDLIRDAAIITPVRPANRRVGLGARVRLRTDSGEESFRIVGRIEADPSAGRISNESPLGRAVLGHGQGDRVTWSAPSGVHHATILAVAS